MSAAVLVRVAELLRKLAEVCDDAAAEGVATSPVGASAVATPDEALGGAEGGENRDEKGSPASRVPGRSDDRGEARGLPQVGGSGALKPKRPARFASTSLDIASECDASTRRRRAELRGDDIDAEAGVADREPIKARLDPWRFFREPEPKPEAIERETVAGQTPLCSPEKQRLLDDLWALAWEIEDTAFATRGVDVPSTRAGLLLGLHGRLTDDTVDIEDACRSLDEALAGLSGLSVDAVRDSMRKYAEWLDVTALMRSPDSTGHEVEANPILPPADEQARQVAALAEVVASGLDVELDAKPGGIASLVHPDEPCVRCGRRFAYHVADVVCAGFFREREPKPEPGKPAAYQPWPEMWEVIAALDDRAVDPNAEMPALRDVADELRRGADPRPLIDELRKLGFPALGLRLGDVMRARQEWVRGRTVKRAEVLAMGLDVGQFPAGIRWEGKS